MCRMDDKLIEEQLRNRALIHLIDGTVFEYDVSKEILWLYTEEGREVYEGYEEQIEPEARKRIHPEDKEKLYRNILQEKELTPIEFRKRMGTDSYGWYRLSSLRLCDREGNLWRIMGVLKNIDHEKQLLKDYQMDALTGAYNRRYLEGALHLYFRQKPPNAKCALLLLDIDHFKALNDTLGHATGDKVLQDLVKLIRQSFRMNDDVCRLGGDEFLIVMKNIYENEVVVAKAKRLIREFEEYAGQYDISPPITISIGIAIVNREEDLRQSIYGSADQALYEAKRQGKNTCCICTDESIGQYDRSDG